MDDIRTAVERWQLLRHPFYQAWSEGTLPIAALRRYAAEWGAFIAMVPVGWRTLGADHHAAEEEEHARLWDQFARALGTRTSDNPATREVRELVSTAGSLFTRPADAAGALYAFESQQPATATAKLEGLRKHYDLPPEAETYFAVHAGDYGEEGQLTEIMHRFQPGDRERAVTACQRMSEALWNGLTGIQRTPSTVG